MDLRDLKIEFTRHEALAGAFHATHFYLDAAPTMIATPFFPERAAQVFRRTKRVVSGDRASGIGCPWLSVPSRRDYGNGTTAHDGIIAIAGGVCSVCGGAADLLVWRDLAKQLGRHRRISNIAAGDLNSANIQFLLVDPEMDFAPDMPFYAAMLACVPLTFALDLDPGAVDQEMQWAL